MKEEASKIDKHLLSKSTFLRGLQCTKSLYLHRYHPEFRDRADQHLLEIFRRGTDVGLVARDLYPGGLDASPETPLQYQKSVLYTRQLLSEDIEVLYEAAFQYDGVLCAIDILVSDGGSWRAYEVKSSTGISDTYIMDASLQYYVMMKSGLPLEDISLVYIDNQYVRRGELNVHSLFKIKSVLQEVHAHQEFVSNNIGKLKGVLKEKIIPPVDIDEHCFTPYECDFKGYCWKHIPDDSVFDIAGLSKAEMFKIYREGIVKLEDIPDGHHLNHSQHMQVECHRTNRIHIDYEGIKGFLNAIRHPLYFMDFETFMPAVPLFENTRPYQQIPFQYSLHYRAARGSGVRHCEFLAEAGADPRLQFIERLLEDTRGRGDIIVYNKSFEKKILTELARDYPAYAKEIKERISRIKDLMLPFQKKYYYAPEMRGSYSIKRVAPALAPELDYDYLSISDGISAMSAFERLQHETDESVIDEVRRNLLEYCRQDTLAMVRLLEKLEEVLDS
jgi:hypothetical protein